MGPQTSSQPRRVFSWTETGRESGRVVDGTLSRGQYPPRGTQCLGMNVARTSKVTAFWKPGDLPASVEDLAEVLGFL